MYEAHILQRLTGLWYNGVWLALLFGLLCSAPLYAQNTAALRGHVVDDTGAVIPGAQITLTAADGKRRNVTANAAGEFVIANVAPGAYQLTATFKGFQPYIADKLQLTATNAPLKITLAVAAVQIETTVNAEQPGVSVEPDNNLNATVLDEQFVQTLPDNEDDMLAFLQGLAGPAAGGAMDGQGGAQIYVDGFTGGHLPPREAILQIRINQNPFTAEYATPGVGRIDIITKPGRDTWRGTFSFNARNSALDARNAFALAKPDLSQDRFQFNLGGPLIAKKLSFFLNAERRTLTGSSTVVADTLAGPFVANVNAPSTSTNFSARLDYLLNPKNTLNISYNLFSTAAANREFGARFGGGGGGGGTTGGNSFLLPERGSNSDNTNDTLQLGETSIINSRLILESRLRYQHENNRATADTTGVAINVLDAFGGGGATCCPSRTRQDNLEWQDYLTWTKQKHTLKSGIQLQYDNIRDNSALNFNGTFTFSSLAQYAAVLAGAHVDPNDPASPLVTPTQFTINQGNPLVRFKQYQAAWFVQDDWRLRPNLTVSLGLRHELQTHVNDQLNFAPRLGLAWSPFKDHKTTVRVGGGIFYSRLTDNLYENVLRNNGVTQQSFLIHNPSWPDPFAVGAPIDTSHTITRTLDLALRVPYTLNFTGSVERQLPRGWVGSVTLIYARGLHQFRTRDINAPLTGLGVRPEPTQGDIYQIEASAKSLYEGVMFSAQRRMGKLFQLFSNYTYSHTLSDSDGALTLPADNYNLRSEWGPASTNRRHFLFVGGSATLPYGFRLNPFLTASSGAPFNLTTGLDANNDGQFNDRPAGINRNSNLPASLYSLIPNRCIAGCAPGGAAVLLQDYLATNFPHGVTVIGPGSFNFNLGLSRTFSFGHREKAAAAQTDAGGDTGGPPAGRGMGTPGGGFGGGRGGGFGGGG
ncbi:MAG: carboxypeptidase regulatory-like domain-containing protein, partial [Acidobacteria bacterium]|nr:carboxypeptidase regulatory-like domain-containing protein [Acidobacteriota bacterium]